VIQPSLEYNGIGATFSALNQELHHLPQQRNPWWAKLSVTQYTALHAGEAA
jgi:hypothetical protein